MHMHISLMQVWGGGQQNSLHDSHTTLLWQTNDSLDVFGRRETFHHSDVKQQVTLNAMQFTV